jgi:division/cell wall cluster transcriptional repressor MraZ
MHELSGKKHVSRPVSVHSRQQGPPDNSCPLQELSAPALVVTRHPGETCLLAMPMARWIIYTEKLDSLPMVDEDSALLRRMLYSAAEDLRLDGQGRILLSQRLRDYATLMPS